MMGPTTVMSNGNASAISKSKLENGTGNGHHVSASSEDDVTIIGDPVDKINTSTDSHCSSLSDGENYECYGEVDMDTSPQILNGSANKSPFSSNLTRNTWLRTSLRRSSPSHNDNLPNRKWGSFRQSSGKRLSSNALASQLYRSSSFNSSGRSSTCDTGDDVYSDVSLEEDVLDLNHKVELLQQQMSVLADNQTHADERYTRAKQENAALQARVLMLEEQLREVELRSEERLAEEAKRHRELVARVDRENQLQVENCAIKLQTVELENKNLRDEALRCRSLAEKAKEEKRKIEENLIDAESNVITLREEIEFFKRQEQKYMEQSRVQEQLLKELSAELEQLRQERNAHIAALNSPNNVATELQQQLDVLRTQYRNLQEQYDELQALLLSRSVEEGRTLLTGSNSLAAELEAMTQDDSGECSLQTQKMKTALKEQQEVNSQLRAYIDGILLNIVENYPQLLEVKCTPSSSSTSSGPNS
ncbi:unnamed protein product [Bemisia tabaci]|uniref:FIP-RBD domain-containing protein n=1 Tax=Bemisia tabaci TaxID=7038 RepID=A0A9P0AEJ6_BEMTA|nr:PREDICTED: rab11 family-interacting protein 4 isoform X1 [Bemisia tabaci]XP_018899020.1 PREDICTED: rab11 family-interacting protein 4 isoform X1 [Bemisia tabaci]CAH0389567.1 unnamed protein product [Bemisia tabaci]